ncbi:hypothetical protein PIB30_075992 [Stylosanthes scabra]|uniref:Putative plant transposon protein domain-containing protein n=1 Tax=Stylosanthes scabra TaxID=79078 RepID=A0ABU6SR42_9FABA|nr:hypothetical protein [Stylosanthes scabra]
MTFGAETDFKTRQFEDRRLDDVIREICMPGAQWKMSSSQPPHPIQLGRQDLTPLARGWAEFIIHSMIPTGNKSEITVARAVLIHSIIKGHDEAGVPMGEFKHSEQIQIARPITAKVMTTTRGRIINQPQNQPMEKDEDNYDAENLYSNHEQDQEMHYEATRAEEDNYQYHEQPNFEAYESNFQQYKEDQQQGFQFLNEELASMKIREEQFFENMQKAQSQYLEELKLLSARQDEMANQQNNFYKQIKREQEKTIKEIKEVKKFQDIVVGLINKQTPNLVEIPPYKIPDFLHNNWQTRRTLTMELSSQISNKENPPKLLTKLLKTLLILRIKVV